jgi:hypothetical protein
VEAYAHLPFVRLDSAKEVPLGQGALVALAFEEWSEIDSEFPFAERAFARVSPVFYRRHFAEDDGPSDEIVEDFDKSVSLVYRTLLLATMARLPSPAMSIRYFSTPRSTLRHVGPFGREYVLYAENPLVVLDDTQTTFVGRTLALLDRAAGALATGELAGAVSTVERTARSELSRLNAFVHGMIALDELLMPETRVDLTQTFARRLAALVTLEADSLVEAEEVYERLYKVRSKALHGESYDDVIAEAGAEEDTFLGWGLTMLPVAVVCATAYCAATGETLASLRRELDAVWHEPGRLAEFHRRYVELLP